MFRDYLTVEKQSQALTVETYARELNFLSDFLELAAISIYDITLDHVQSYLIFRNEQQELTGRTINKIVSVLNHFFNFCQKEKILPENPMRFLKKAKARATLPVFMTVDEVEKFLSTIDSSTVLGMRDRALFELIYACGLRVHEVVSLTLPALFLQDEYILIQGKGNKERIVPVGEQAIDTLNCYLKQARPSLVNPRYPTNNVFLNYRGTPLSRKGIWKKFKQILGPAAKKFKVHSLRHSFATHLLQSGMNLRAVQELLGHSNLSTTSIYTNISDDTLQKSHTKYHT